MRKKSIEARAAEALATARELAKTANSWIDVHNGLYGIGGACGALFADAGDRAAFVKTDEHREIQRIMEELRAAKGDPPTASTGLDQANGRILVRVPRSLHAALLAEAAAEGVSLNQLMVSKLSMQLRALV